MRENGGHVRLFRRVYDNPIFADKVEASVFIWMFGVAAWRPVQVRYKDRIIDLKRGQLAISIRDLARDWGWSKTKAHRFICKLITGTMIETCNGTGVLVVTICNYDEYQPAAGQSPGRPSGQDRDRTGTQNKEGKELKEEEGNIGGRELSTPTARAREAPPTLKSVPEDWKPSEPDMAFAIMQAATAGLPDDAIAWPTEVAAYINHHRGQGKIVADPSAAWRSWAIRAVGFAKRDRATGQARAGPAGRRSDLMAGFDALDAKIAGRQT